MAKNVQYIKHLSSQKFLQSCVHFTSLTITIVNMNNRMFCFSGGSNSICAVYKKKVDDSSANNYYDKKGYSFSQTTNALSLAHLSLLTPAFICWVTSKSPNHTHSTRIHFSSRLDKRRLFNRQTTSTEKERKKGKTQTQIKAEFPSSFNYFPLLSVFTVQSFLSDIHTCSPTVLTPVHTQTQAAKTYCFLM